jgi:hypothetical protein
VTGRDRSIEAQAIGSAEPNYACGDVSVLSAK